MSILNVVEYKEERVAIIEDTKGKYLVTESDPRFIPLEALFTVVSKTPPLPNFPIVKT
jgi:hypothetical protein